MGGADALLDDLSATVRYEVSGLKGKDTHRHLLGAVTSLCALRGAVPPSLHRKSVAAMRLWCGVVWCGSESCVSRSSRIA